MNIDDELEPLTVYNYDVSSGMDSLVKYVLRVIPDDYAEQFPSFSVFEAYSPWHAHVEEGGKIFCDSSLLNIAKDIAIGTLAHEFAHLFLGHPVSGGLEDEYKADELACQWGFQKEVAAMREQFGPPTLKCSRCGHTWIPRQPKNPKVCPKCTSPYWNKPKWKGGEQ